MYNYLEAMKEDIKNYVEENEIEIVTYGDLYDDLFCKDSITGNESGSYTFNRAEAKEYVIDNLDVLADACSEYGVSMDELGRRFLNEEWEWLDVTIRCYLLGEALSELDAEM